MNNLILIISCGILFLTSILFAWYIFRQKNACAQSKICEKQWKSLVDNIPDILIRINHDMHIEYINPASKSLLRISPLTYLDKPIQTLLDQEKISGLTVTEIQQLFDNGKQLFKEFSISYDKQIRHLEFRIIPELDKNNHVNTILIIGRDISKRKHTEAKLHLAKREAEDSDRLKSAFLANMSHEIRTPLNAIVGFANIILEEDLTVQEKEKYFSYINQNSNQLIALINDIIDISKIESGQLKIQNSEFNLNQHLREVEEIIANEKLNRNKDHLLVFLENEFADNLCNISTDPYRLRQILINLLVNAVKFTPKGFIQFGYRLLEDQKLLFYVRDSGIGISKEDQKLIFQHFRKLDNTISRRHGGTGLGLAISENLVNLMGGKIWLQSDIGKGTTFYFTIPVKGVDDLKKAKKDQYLEK